jgi:hypothetical protein
MCARPHKHCTISLLFTTHLCYYVVNREGDLEPFGGFYFYSSF